MDRLIITVFRIEYCYHCLLFRVLGGIFNSELIFIYFSQDVEKKEDGVTDDLPPEMYIKHPLQNTWTLWYYENDKNKNWGENQKVIASFQTAEDFWRYS